MKPTFVALAALLAAALLPPGAHAQGREVTLAVASTFTTTDPYDANDTLSQAVAKSFYQGLYGVVQTALLGLVLAVFTLRWRTLWPAILAHAAVNILSVVQLREIGLPEA